MRNGYLAASTSCGGGEEGNRGHFLLFSEVAPMQMKESNTHIVSRIVTTAPLRFTEVEGPLQASGTTTTPVPSSTTTVPSSTETLNQPSLRMKIEERTLARVSFGTSS